MKIKTSYGDITYTRVGHGKFTILFLHGTPGDSRQFSSYLANILEKFDCDVVSVDRSGYGGTSKTDILHLSYQISEVLNVEGVSSVVIYAVEFGACVAFQFTKLFPDNVKGILLENPTMNIESFNLKYTQSIIPYKAATNILWSIFCRFLSKYFVSYSFNLFKKRSDATDDMKSYYERSIERPSFQERYRKLIDTMTRPKIHRSGFLWDMKQLKNNRCLPINNVSCITYVMYGAKNKSISKHDIKHISESLPSAKIHIYDKGDYYIPLSLAKEEYFRHKLKFFNEVTGKSGKGIDKKISDYTLPDYCTRYPSRLAANIIEQNNFVVVDGNGLIYKEINQEMVDMLSVYGKSYREPIHDDELVELFSINSETGGYIPCILTPCIQKSTDAVIIFEVDSYRTTVKVPKKDKEIRAVFGGYFPLHKLSEKEVEFTLNEKSQLNVVSPVSEIEAKTKGLYFHSSFKLYFKGKTVKENNGNFALLTYLLFEKRIYD